MRRDEGSILKELKNGKHTGRWYARLRYTDADGKRCEKKRTCLTSAQARAMITTLRNEIAEDAIKAETNSKTYRELDADFRKRHVHAAKFVGGKKVSGLRQPIKAVEHYLNRLLDHFGDREVSEITFAEIDAFKQKLAANVVVIGKGENQITRPRSVADVSQTLRKLRRMFTFAIEEGVIDVSPFKRGRGLVAASFEVERTRILTPAEETRLLAACQDKRRSHILPIIIFALDTAARRNELLACKWIDVNLPARSIRLRNKSANLESTRLAPITARLADLLADLRRHSTGRVTDRVFNVADFKRAWTTARRDAGIPDIHFHDLRHTAITRMLEKGIPQPLVMKISGHTQLKTFLRYVNQSEASITEIADLLDRQTLPLAMPLRSQK